MAKQPTPLSAAESPLGKAILRILDPALDAARYDDIYEDFSAEVMGQQGQAVTPAWAKEILLATGFFDEETIDQLLPDAMEEGMVRVFWLRYLNPVIPWKEVVDLNSGPLHRVMAFVLWHNAMAPTWMMEDSSEVINQTFDTESEFMVNGMRESPLFSKGEAILLDELTSCLKNYFDLDDLLSDILAPEGDHKISRHLSSYRKTADKIDTYVQAETRLREAGHADMADHILRVSGSDINAMVEIVRHILHQVLVVLREEDDELPALAACISLAQSLRARLGLPPYRSIYERIL